MGLIVAVDIVFIFVNVVLAVRLIGVARTNRILTAKLTQELTDAKRLAQMAGEVVESQRRTQARHN